MLFHLYFKLMTRIEAMQSDETGATAVEYGMIVALIAAAIVTLVAYLGDDIKLAFQAIVTALPGGHA